MNEIICAAAILGALSALLLGVRALQSAKRVGPEISRKLIHIGMGAIALVLPWAFHRVTPVWILALLALSGLGAVRFVPPITASLGSVLGGVSRVSLGELYFPIGVAAAFTLAGRNHAAYCGAVCVLAFADSAGALVGSRWGTLRYALLGDSKSVEGSAAVLITSVISVGPAVFLFDSEPFLSALRCGFVVGAAATFIEAVSRRGLDNLLLPLASVVLIVAWSVRGTGRSNAWLISEIFIGVAFAAYVVAVAIAVTRRGSPRSPALNLGATEGSAEIHRG